MSFEDLVRVNSEIQTKNIKDKEYAEVNQRIIAFRKLYPEGYIETKLISNEDDMCIIQAEVGYYVIKEDGYIMQHCLGQGIAYEKEGSSFINKTSYIENCETSAVGRALGMAGFGIDVSIASAEEVQNAIKQQEDPVISKAQDKAIRNVVENHNISTEKVKELLEKRNHTKLIELKQSEYMDFYKELTNEK